MSAIRRGAADGGRVYLTFDDGPDREWTPSLLDMLAAAGARATFFVIGRAAQRSTALVRRVRAAGHEVGNHSYSHRHPWTLSTAQARHEVRAGADAIADVLGERPRWFRPAHGRMRAAMTDEAQLCGQQVVLWSLSAIDWGPLGRSERIAARLAQVAAGDIVLMHDGRHRHNRPAEMLRALPDFLSLAAGRGFVPSPLDNR